MKRLCKGEITEVDDVIISPEEQERQRIEEVATNIERVWQAAHYYEYAQISGTAVGLLTAGVLQALPKSLAVQAWCGSIWDIYFANKDIIESGGDFSESMLDYSSVGDIPHTIPELREEIGM